MKFDDLLEELVKACEQEGDNFERRIAAEEALGDCFSGMADNGKRIAFHSVVGILSEVMFKMAWMRRKVEK